MAEPLSCEEAVALLSAFVFQQRTDDASELNRKITRSTKKLVGIAQSLAAVQMDHGLEVSFPPLFSFMRGLFEVELTD